MYIIESNTHGAYTGIDWSQSGNSYGPRFSYSIPRSDAWVFTTLADAQKALVDIKNFKHYAWKPQAWINQLSIIDLSTGKPVPSQQTPGAILEVAYTPFDEKVNIIEKLKGGAVLVEHSGGTRETWQRSSLRTTPKRPRLASE